MILLEGIKVCSYLLENTEEEAVKEEARVGVGGDRRLEPLKLDTSRWNGRRGGHDRKGWIFLNFGEGLGQFRQNISKMTVVYISISRFNLN